METQELFKLQEKAKELRIQVLDDIFRAGVGTIGGIYSAVDLFVYLHYGKHGLKLSDIRSRDHFILGKGHASLALFHIWADLGMLDKEYLPEYGVNGGRLGELMYTGLPYADYNCGSLGHAVGIAAGYALADRIDRKDHISLAFVGDGECSEGSIWEAAAFCGNEKINNVICIVDYNGLGASDAIVNDGGLESIRLRFESCGWDVSVIDGHNFEEIEQACAQMRTKEKPFAIIAKTVKGKGVSFMENGVHWHNAVPNKEQYQQARKELCGE